MTHIRTRACVTLAALALPVALAAPATASTTGSERLDGVIVTTGKSGIRTVLASPVLAVGPVTGVGRIVEIPNEPTDPDNVSRDDLVFRAGTLHLLSAATDVSFSLDPATCRFHVVVQQTLQITGGTAGLTGVFGALTGSVTANGLTGRNPDGTCSQDQAPITEIDTITATGTVTR